jgi:hypothetical protein
MGKQTAKGVKITYQQKNRRRWRLKFWSKQSFNPWTSGTKFDLGSKEKLKLRSEEWIVAEKRKTSPFPTTYRNTSQESSTKRGDTPFQYETLIQSKGCDQQRSNAPDLITLGRETARWSNGPNVSSWNDATWVPTHRSSSHLLIATTRGKLGWCPCQLKGHVNLLANFSCSTTASLD